MSEETKEVIYLLKVVDEVSAGVKTINENISALNEKVAAIGKTSEEGFGKLGKTAETGTLRVSQMHGEIAKANEFLRQFGIELDTIDIYMLSAFKVIALMKLIETMKDAVLETEKLKNSLAGISALSSFYGKDASEYFKVLVKGAEDGQVSIKKLAQTMLNLQESGLNPEQVDKTIQALKVLGTVQGTRGDASLEDAMLRVSEGLLNLQAKALRTVNTMLDVVKVENDWATAHNILNRELTDTEKRLAVAEALWQAAAKDLDAYNIRMQGLTGELGRFRKSWEDIKLFLGDMFAGPAQVGLAGIRLYLEQIKDRFADLNIAAGTFYTISKTGNIVLADLLGLKWGNLVSDIKNAGTEVKNLAVGIQDILDKPLEKLISEVPKVDSGMRADPNAQASLTFKERSAILKSLDELNLTIAEKTGSALQRRLAVEDKFYSESAAKLTDAWMKKVITEEDYDKRFEDLTILTETRKQTIRDEFANASSEKQLNLQIKSEEITSKFFGTDAEVSLKKQIDLNQQLYDVEVKHLATLDVIKNSLAYEAQIAKINKVTEAIMTLRAKELEYEGTFEQGMASEVQKMYNDRITTFRAGIDVIKSGLDGLQSTISTSFFDMMQGKITTWQQSFLSAIATVQKAFADMIGQFVKGQILSLIQDSDWFKTAGASIQKAILGAQGGAQNAAQFAPAISGLTSAGIQLSASAQALITAASALGGQGAGSGVSGLAGLFSGFGGGGTSWAGGDMASSLPMDMMVAHDGGFLDKLPRFHGGGLASDEVPLIGQVGERMLSIEQNKLFEAFIKKTNAPSHVVNYNISTMDSASFGQFARQNSHIFADAMVHARSYNNPERRP